MKDSDFRNWVRLIWLENYQEYENYHQIPIPIGKYWKQYKWWLKREYQYQKKKR